MIYTFQYIFTKITSCRLSLPTWLSNYFLNLCVYACIFLFNIFLINFYRLNRKKHDDWANSFLGGKQQWVDVRYKPMDNMK